MVESVLLFSATTTILVAVAYLYLAVRLAKRRRADDADATRALRMFAAWWGLTAANQILASGLYVAAAFGWTDKSAMVAYVVVQRLLLSASLVGLMAYLLYLFRGRQHLVALSVFYALFFAFQLWTVFAQEPSGVLVSRWRTDLVYTASVPAWTGLVTLVVVVLPALIGSLAYLRFLGRVPTRSQRARILAIGVGLTVWWVLALVAGQRAAYDSDAIQLANRTVGLVVALAILFAFEPTPWMQKRLRIEPYGSPRTA